MSFRRDTLLFVGNVAQATFFSSVTILVVKSLKEISSWHDEV